MESFAVFLFTSFIPALAQAAEVNEALSERLSVYTDMSSNFVSGNSRNNKINDTELTVGLSWEY